MISHVFKIILVLFVFSLLISGISNPCYAQTSSQGKLLKIDSEKVISNSNTNCTKITGTLSCTDSQTSITYYYFVIELGDIIYTGQYNHSWLFGGKNPVGTFIINDPIFVRIDNEKNKMSLYQSHTKTIKAKIVKRERVAAKKPL